MNFETLLLIILPVPDKPQLLLRRRRVNLWKVSSIIEDWCLDNRPRLREKEISDIRLVNPTSTDLHVNVYDGCTLSDDEIMTMLKDDSKIATNLSPDSQIVGRFKSQLLAFASPVCQSRRVIWNGISCECQVK